MIKVGDIVDYFGKAGVVMKEIEPSKFNVKILHDNSGMAPTITAKAGELGERFMTSLDKSELYAAVRFLQQIIRNDV